MAEFIFCQNTAKTNSDISILFEAFWPNFYKIKYYKIYQKLLPRVHAFKRQIATFIQNIDFRKTIRGLLNSTSLNSIWLKHEYTNPSWLYYINACRANWLNFMRHYPLISHQIKTYFTPALINQRQILANHLQINLSNRYCRSFQLVMANYHFSLFKSTKQYA